MKAEVVSASVLALMASPAVSCTLFGSDTTYVDPPIRVGSDCSFVEAGNNLTDVFAGKAFDLKNQKIGQRITNADKVCGLPPTESIIVVDCSDLATIMISGQPPKAARLANPKLRDTWYGVETKSLHLYPPHGEIRLHARVTISELEAISSKEHYSHTTNILRWVAGFDPENRPDPFCGCEVFYPDSLGAAVN